MAVNDDGWLYELYGGLFMIPPVHPRFVFVVSSCSR